MASVIPPSGPALGADEAGWNHGENTPWQRLVACSDPALVPNVVDTSDYRNGLPDCTCLHIGRCARNHSGSAEHAVSKPIAVSHHTTEMHRAFDARPHRPALDSTSTGHDEGMAHLARRIVGLEDCGGCRERPPQAAARQQVFASHPSSHASSTLQQRCWQNTLALAGLSVRFKTAH